VARIIPLNKTLKYGVSYRTHPRVAYKISKIGTNSTSGARLKVENRSLGEIITNIAPEFKTNSTIVGPLDLGDLFYVIPPDTDFIIEGSSGDRIHVIGDIILLDPGEGLGADLLDRFHKQDKHYLTYVAGSYAFGTDEAWANGVEVELLTLTPKTIEKYIFKYPVFLEISNATISPGDVVINIYLDDTPWEYLESTNLAKGIDAYDIPAYNDISKNEVPFTLEHYPIELVGDHTLKVTVKNISGADITPPTGSAISLALYMVTEYIRG